MAEVDASIALNKDGPNLLHTLSSFMDLGRKKVEFDKMRATYDADVARVRADSAKAGTEAGVAADTAASRVSQQASTAKSLEANATVDQANVGPAIEQKAAESRAAKSHATHVQYRLDAEQARDVLQNATGLYNNPVFSDAAKERDPVKLDAYSAKQVDAINGIADQMEASGVSKAKVRVLLAPLYGTAGHNPAATQQLLATIIKSQVGAPGQAALATPTGIPVTDNQKSTVISNAPLSGVPMGEPIPGTTRQQFLPPTTPVFNDAAQAQGYYGPQGAGARPSPPGVGQPGMVQPAGPPRGFVASGPKLGQETNAQGSVATVNKDWQETNDNAANAARNIGLLQNIKQYAGDAVKGVAADRRSFAAGLAGLIGMDAGEAAKTATDRLAKNTAMLALTGGNTDMARTLALAMNPNNHMTEEAIKGAADQVMAQQQMALAKQQFLGKFKDTDPQKYAQQLSVWNKIADPRVFEWPSMSVKDKKAMVKSMNPAQREDFERKLEVSEQFGFIK